MFVGMEVKYTIIIRWTRLEDRVSGVMSCPFRLPISFTHALRVRGVHTRTTFGRILKISAQIFFSSFFLLAPNSTTPDASGSYIGNFKLRENLTKTCI